MFDDSSAAEALRTYLLETAPVLALRLDQQTRVAAANAQARHVLGEQVIGRALEEIAPNGCDASRLAAILQSGDRAHILSFDIHSGMPESLYFRFFSLPDGWLALGSFDLEEQQKMFGQLLALNSDLSNTTRELHHSNAKLREMTELNGKLAEELKEHTEMLRQQTLASLNLMEDTLAARDRAEQAYAALQQSEAQFRCLVEAAPDAIFVHAGLRFRYLNATGCRLLGASSPEQILNTPVMDRIHPSFWDMAEERMQKLRDRKEAVLPAEVSWVRLDGSTVPVESTSLAISFQGEDAVLVFARDITERKKAAEALKRSEQNYRTILEAAPDAIVVHDEQGDIVLVNTEAERMFGISREALLRHNISLLLPQRFRQDSEHPANSFANPEAAAMGAPSESFGLRADGTEFPIEVTVSPLDTGQGTLMLNGIRDVTERNNTERRSRQLEIMAAEAEAASKAKSVFLSTMSHEIRTPMNAILGYAQLMLRDPTLGSDAKANLKIISRSGEHLLDVINQVLDMAKIEAGRVEINRQTLDLPALVRDLEAMFRLKAEANALHFEVMVGGELIQYISADEGRIRQVLINLLGNAVKFTERGRITLRVSLDYRADHRLWLSAQVEDTGVGMSADELAKLFQPFVQGQAGQQIRHGGTGLGLAISQGVARLMGGDISASSRLGKGSRFCFEIPVEHSAELDFIGNSGAHRRVIGIQAPRQPPCILIADDVADNRDWLSRLLASVGFSVRTVEDGQAAVQVWEEWHPHLILMDMHMPVMGGLEATWRIRSRPKGKDTVIIALTADVLDGHRRAVLGSEVNDFLPKPCPEGDLLEKIRKHLGLVYLYREETEADPADAAGLAAALNPEQMRAIPADLIGQLHEATVSGDKARLDELISTVNSAGATQPALALQELADSYEYDRLIQLLESA